MNKEIEQILKNQKTIMSFLHFGFKEQQTDMILGDALSKRFEESSNLLNPIQEPTIAEEREDALNVKREKEWE